MSTADADLSHWARVKESGSFFGMRLLLGIYRIGGKPLFQFCLLPVVLFYSVCHPVAVGASRQYRRRMAQFNPAFPPPRPWHGFRHMWSFANALLDKLAVWMGRIRPDDVVVHNREQVKALLDRGQGAVLLISHLGNFEVCQALSEHRSHLQLTVLHHTRHAEKFNRLLRLHNRDSRIEFIQVTDLNVAQAMRLSEQLAAGRFIVISADRMAVNNPGRAKVRSFLGRPAAFATGPFVLASALQAPIISLQCILEEGRYHIYFDQLSEGGAVPRRQRDAALEQLMDAYIARLENYCVKAPWQWFNFYPYWREDKEPS